MFNREYRYNIDDLIDMLNFPFGEGTLCEAPLETDWVFIARRFQGKLDGFGTDNFEENVASSIQNPTIHYFPQNFCDIICSHHHTHKANAKEMFYMQVVLFDDAPQGRINSVPFKLTHMSVIVIAKKGVIYVGGLIISIAHAIGLEAELATFEPIQPCFFDICAYSNMRFVRARKDKN